MNVGELKEVLKNVDDKTELFFRPRDNPCGYIISVDYVIKSIYGSLGEVLDCLVFDDQNSASSNDTILYQNI